MCYEQTLHIYNYPCFHPSGYARNGTETHTYECITAHSIKLGNYITYVKWVRKKRNADCMELKWKESLKGRDFNFLKIWSSCEIGTLKQTLIVLSTWVCSYHFKNVNLGEVQDVYISFLTTYQTDLVSRQWPSKPVNFAKARRNFCLKVYRCQSRHLPIWTVGHEVLGWNVHRWI